MLLDYVRDYLARGDAALIEYHDQSRGVRLDEEHRSLLEASLYINDFAPELTKYLKGFPRPELTDVENNIDWTKINFGLKPVTILTHVATYTRRPSGVPQILVVSKQLYANHYFDSAIRRQPFPFQANVNHILASISRRDFISVDTHSPDLPVIMDEARLPDTAKRRRQVRVVQAHPPPCS